MIFTFLGKFTGSHDNEWAEFIALSESRESSIINRGFWSVANFKRPLKKFVKLDRSSGMFSIEAS